MPALIVALQRGFDHDEVAIKINGQPVFTEEGVTTNLLRGYAKSFQVEVVAGAVTLEMSVPTRNLAQHYQWAVATTLYVGLSIAWDGSTLECTTSDQPFAYI